MFRRFREPFRWDFETEEEYNEEYSAWEREMQDREDELVERWAEQLER